MYVLLRDNYVEDDSGTLRFDYSKEFLLWALNPPNAKIEWTLGIRESTSNELVGFGSGVPITMNSRGVDVPMALINFLCLKKNIRQHKGLTPLILAEGIRRAEISDVLQLVFTSGKILPTPFASPMYWYRDLNPEKTLHIGYSAKPMHLSLEEYYCINHVPENIVIDLRPMTQADVPQVTILMNKQMRELYEFSVIFTEQDVSHWLLPRPDVVYSYVCCDGDQVTDMVSYYNLSSTVMGNDLYNNIKCAYAWYSFAKDNSAERTIQLFWDALVLAKRNGFDSFNATEVC